ncbi:MAG: domain containing protein [Herbaspirillum sp.]|jgi:cell division protein ZapB|nr:domain containing protein [Herbaspirillum sp.]
MIPEFNSLSEKVGRLALLAQTLRQENADLRLHLSSLNNDKEALTKRMNEAHRRIAALLEKLPETESDAESNAEPDAEPDLEYEEPEFAEEKAV